jgi:Na+/melibiose symporter-like transporter
MNNTLWVVLVAFSLAGVQFVYSIQFAIGTPLFADKLGFNIDTVGIILATAGPISGFIVQPVIGVLSDSYESRFGRRRPFIFVGALFCAIGMTLIAWCTRIEDFFVSKGSKSENHLIGRIVAIAGFWIMNLFVNVIQGPSRALVNDLVSENQLQTANSIVVFVMSFSAVTATIVGANFQPASNDNIQEFQKEPFLLLFMVGVVFLLVSIVPTIVAGKEAPYRRKDNDKKPSFVGVFIQIFKAFIGMDREMVKIVLLFFFSWSSYTPIMIYQTQYYSKVVFGGRIYGLRIGMYSLALFNTLLFIYSLISPQIGKKIGIRAVYFITQLIAMACYILTYFIYLIPENYKPYYALTLTTLVCFNFNAFNSIPFALVAEITGGKNSGLNMGVLNSAAVVSQTITSLIISFTVLSSPKKDISLAIATGAVSSIIACILVFFISTKKNDGYKELNINRSQLEE